MLLVLFIESRVEYRYIFVTPSSFLMAVVRAKLKDYIINKYRVAAFLDKLKHNEYIFYEIPGQVFLERMKSPRYNDDNIYFH